MKTEKELYKMWKKYIDVPMYLVVPKRMLSGILKKGIDPHKDPYENIKPKIKKFAKIIYQLEKGGFVIKIRWGRPVHASYAITVSLNDLKTPVVDFAPTIEDVEYYLKLKGGATVSNIKRLTKKIIEANPNLTENQWHLINGLNKWAKSKICDNTVISVNGGSNCFETSRFQLIRRGKGGRKKYRGPKYLPSPFGSFEHFKRIIKNYGWRKYSYRLRNYKYYLRVTEKIPAMEIKVLR